METSESFIMLSHRGAMNEYGKNRPNFYYEALPSYNPL